MKKQNKPDWAKLYKMLDKADILMFDPKKISEKIEKSYRIREKAHRLMLEADILLDEVLKQVYGERKNKRS